MGIFAVAKALEIPCYLGPEEFPASKDWWIRMMHSPNSSALTAVSKLAATPQALCGLHDSFAMPEAAK